MNTPILLHGLAWDDLQPEGAPTHERVAVGPLVALVTPTPGDLADVEAARAAALTHDTLLATYHRTGSVLPVNFGTCFSSEDQLARALAADVAKFEARLHELSGLAEFALELEGKPAAAPAGRPTAHAQIASGSGRSYLASRAAARQKHGDREAALGDLGVDLATTAGAFARKIVPRRARQGRPLSLSCLLSERDAARLDAALAPFRYRAAQFGIALRFKGPWPPYSFAAEASSNG